MFQSCCQLRSLSHIMAPVMWGKISGRYTSTLPSSAAAHGPQSLNGRCMSLHIPLRPGCTSLLSPGLCAFQVVTIPSWNALILHPSPSSSMQRGLLHQLSQSSRAPAPELAAGLEAFPRAEFWVYPTQLRPLRVHPPQMGSSCSVLSAMYSTINTGKMREIFRYC